MTDPHDGGEREGAPPTEPEAPSRSTASDPFHLSRRSFLRGASGVAAGGVAAGRALADRHAAERAAARGTTLAGKVPTTLSINGTAQQVELEPRTTLLSALRHHLERPLTGTKEVCDRGNCGACTVIVDGEPVYSCLTLAVRCEGKQITTVEGLGSPEDLSDVQAAFCEKDAQMCGFCTPGFVVATTACLGKHERPDRDTIKRELSGNLCRCGTYPHVFDAAEDAAERRRRRAREEGGDGR